MNKIAKRNVLTLLGLCGMLFLALATSGSEAPHSYMSAIYLGDSAVEQQIEGADFNIPDLGMEFVWIEPKRFVMGSSAAEDQQENERLHEVELTQGFWLGKYEVTMSQFESFVRETGHLTQGEMARVLYNSVTGKRHVGKTWRNVFDSHPAKPVVGVSKRDAYAFCRWLTDHERRAGRLHEGYQFALPTEAQWEYACRAGNTDRFSFGDDVDELCLYANYADRSATVENRDESHDDGFSETAPVGSFKPNRWALFDLHGNVCELCSDTYWSAYQESEAVDPLGPAGVRMGQNVVRGGGWSSTSEQTRCAARHPIPPLDAYTDVGFRVALRRGYSAIMFTLTGDNQDWKLIRKGNRSTIIHDELDTAGIARVIDFPHEGSLGFLQARIRERRTGWVYIPARATGHLEVPEEVDIKLNIPEVDTSTSEDLAPLDRLGAHDLQAVEIAEKRLSSGALQHLGHLTGLCELYIHSRRMRDSGLKYLTNLDQLETVDLTDTKVRGPGLGYLQGCRQLSRLVLNSTKLNNDGLAYLGDFKGLRSLELSRTSIGDSRYLGYREQYGSVHPEGLDRAQPERRISRFYQMVERLETTREDGESSLGPLSQLSELEVLDLSGTLVTNSDLADISYLEDLKVLRLRDAPVTSDGLKHLASLSRMREIDLSKTGVDDRGLRQLSKLPSLEKLSAGGMWTAVEAPVKDSGLIRWYKGMTPITDAGLRPLGELRNLRVLDLGSTQLTGEGFSHLVGLADLGYLYLKECRLTDAGLLQIAALPGLKVLDISGNRVTDSGLQHLLRSPTLREVIAVGTLVTEEGAAEFMSARGDVAVILEKEIQVES